MELQMLVPGKVRSAVEAQGREHTSSFLSSCLKGQSKSSMEQERHLSSGALCCDMCQFVTFSRRVQWLYERLSNRPDMEGDLWFPGFGVKWGRVRPWPNRSSPSSVLCSCHFREVTFRSVAEKDLFILIWSLMSTLQFSLRKFPVRSNSP